MLVLTTLQVQHTQLDGLDQSDLQMKGCHLTETQQKSAVVQEMAWHLLLG